MRRNFSTIADSLLNPGSVTRGYWTKKQNQRNFFDLLAKKFNCEKLDDWYKISPKDVAENGGKDLLKYYYGNHLSKALLSVYDEHPWRLWKFEQEKRIPSGFWKDKKLHKPFFDDVAEELKIQHTSDWYDVTLEIIEAKTKYGSNVRTLVNEYYDVKALTYIYSDKTWQLWRFPRTPSSFWENKKNQKEFLDYCWKVLKIESWFQWFRISPRQIAPLGGEGLLRKYDGKLIRALSANYPEYTWSLSVFHDKKNQLDVFEHLAKKLNLQNMEDWYTLKSSDLYPFADASQILSLYNDSIYQALIAIYPEKDWKPWKFHTLPKSFFDKEENVKNYLLAAEKELNLSNWANVTSKQLNSIKYLDSLIAKHGGLCELINKYLPERNLKKEKTFPESVQQALQKSIETAFPKVTVKTKYQLHLSKDGLGEILVLDIYIPELLVAFDYQGEEFYQHGKAIFGTPEQLQKEFRNKQQKCKAKEIKLIDIPYWWNISATNIAQLIK